MAQSLEPVGENVVGRQFEGDAIEPAGQVAAAFESFAAADAAAGASTGAVELLQKQLMPQQQPVVQQHPVQLKQQNLPLNSVFHTLMVMNQW